LFLKIFLWFGAVVLTFIVATSIAGELMHLRFESPRRRPPDPILTQYAKDAAAQYERGGQAALADYFDHIRRHSNTRLLFFNKELVELSGGNARPEAREVAQQVFQTNLPEFSDRGSAPLLGRPVQSETGAQYVLITDLPPRPEFALFHLHLLAMALIGGLFCYWLARHLTAPVAKLRAATRELANGNLSVRVGPALGQRRDELASLASDFDEMAEKIQLLIDSQRRLLGDISHELRSPLARLNVALELARQRSGVEAISALERIQREAEILNEMIGQLLALTRFESGAQEIQKTAIELESLVGEVAKDADFEARARDRSVHFTSAGKMVIDGIPNLIRRAIENVVRNAVHYTAVGTAVDIQLSRDSPTHPDRRNEQRAVLIVRDHGPGVPAEALDKIFRPFYRVDEARDREAGGVGLGLAIAERAVKLHGGSVAASNVADGGLSVTIVLPAVINEKRAAK
jgi:two-component system sensor histidine kinase CpxA